MAFQSETELVCASAFAAASPETIKTVEENETPMKRNQDAQKSGNNWFKPSTLLIGLLMVTLVGSAVGGSFT